jgi:hypothetical protein
MRGPKWRPSNSAYGNWIISFKWLQISSHIMMYAQNIVITITNLGFFRPTTKCGSPASVVVKSDSTRSVGFGEVVSRSVCSERQVGLVGTIDGTRIDWPDWREEGWRQFLENCWIKMADLSVNELHTGPITFMHSTAEFTLSRLLTFRRAELPERPERSTTGPATCCAATTLPELCTYRR